MKLKVTQEIAADAIMNTDAHVLITSRTASGKTEAAFLPALSLLSKKPSKSIGILYISPLKDLINDQNKRLSSLLKYGNIPVFSWNGDVSGSQKQKVLEINQGILQMTPESLEAMLMVNPQNAVRLFSDTQFIIIDEIHSFLGSDRGGELFNLMVRLERLCGRQYRRIALSATLASARSVLWYLSSQTNRKAILCKPRDEEKDVEIYLQTYTIPHEEEVKQKVEQEWQTFLYDQLRDQKAIIFCNSREETESTANALKKIARKCKDPDRFLVHHGSVSAQIRERAETKMKSDEKIVICATVTLELGIDVGDLDLVVELGAPWKVSSLLQRLGRSGRVSKVSKMLMIILEKGECNFILSLIHI